MTRTENIKEDFNMLSYKVEMELIEEEIHFLNSNNARDISLKDYNIGIILAMLNNFRKRAILDTQLKGTQTQLLVRWAERRIDNVTEYRRKFMEEMKK